MALETVRTDEPSIENLLAFNAGAAEPDTTGPGVLPDGRKDEGGHHEVSLADGAVRWLPIGLRPTERPDRTRGRWGNWSGSAFVRCTLTGAETDEWDHDLPGAWDALVSKRIDTGRNSRVLRRLNGREASYGERPIMLTDVSDDPGGWALHGLRLRQGSAMDQLVPVGAVIASYDKAVYQHRQGDGQTEGYTHRGGWWRAWRVPPTGAPYIVLEQPDPRAGRGWLPHFETPQERLARLLDAELAWVFKRRQADLDRDTTPGGQRIAAEHRLACTRWRANVEEALAREDAERRPSRRRRRRGGVRRSGAKRR